MAMVTQGRVFYSVLVIISSGLMIQGVPGSKVPECKYLYIKYGRPDSRTITVKTTSDSSPADAPPHDYADIDMDLCSERKNSKLKLTWEVSQSTEHQASRTLSTVICIKSIVNLVKQGDIDQCYTLTGAGLPRNSGVMECLVDIQTTNNSIIIVRSDVVMEYQDRKYIYYGETFYNPRALMEMTECNYCVNMIPTFRIAAHYTCNTKGEIRCHKQLSVLSMTLRKDNNHTNLNILSKNGTRTEFNVADVPSGSYHLSVITRDRNTGHYCGYNKTVYVVCGEETIPMPFPTDPPESFETFVLIGIVCFAAITAVGVIIRFVVQRVNTRRRDARPASLRQRSLLDVNIPLNNQNNESGTRERNHQPSASTSSGSLSNGKCSNGTKQRSLPREICDDLIEINREPTTIPNILFLPIPYDGYTREIMKLLTNILTENDQIFSQCVFDAEVSNEYNDSNKYNWMDSITRDSHKIVIFLCFASVEGPPREDNIADDLIEHFKKSQPQCHVIFAHLTDTYTNLSECYPGCSINVMHNDGFKDLIEEVLTITGCKFEDTKIVSDIMKSEDARRFLDKIDHKN